MRYALIENNAVVNIIEAESPDALSGMKLVECLDHTLVGDVLLAEGVLPEEILAWSKETREQKRFSESNPPTNEYARKPPPAYCIGWDEVTEEWQIDTMAQLQDAKTAKKTAIDAHTDMLVEKYGLSYNGERFAMTSGAKLNWTGLVATRDLLTYPYHILTIDDKLFALQDQPALLAFVAAVMGYETAANSPLASGRILRQRVEAAESIEEVEAIVDDRE